MKSQREAKEIFIGIGIGEKEQVKYKIYFSLTHP